MTKIIGQIESLKKIRSKLNENGLTGFNSVKDIKDYLSTYKLKEKQILIDTENEVDFEIINLRKELTKIQGEYNQSKIEISNNLTAQISKLIDKVEFIKSAKSSFILIKVYNTFQIKKIETKRKNLEENFKEIIKNQTSFLSSKIQKINNELEELTLNKDLVISNRSKSKISTILYTKDFLERLNPLIAGAIGESLVVKELEKLPDNFIVFNDFSVNYDRPIYNKKSNDWILSIQIDHLLITHSGIFILETKNWSKQSIKNLELRSPIEQIRRTSYALFVMLNSDSEYNYLSLDNHHWGKKQIPIRNIIVMINEKPKEKFKFVTIKSLYELNNYINYFEPIFTDLEIKRISEYLKHSNNLKS